MTSLRKNPVGSRTPAQKSFVYAREAGTEMEVKTRKISKKYMKTRKERITENQAIKTHF